MEAKSTMGEIVVYQPIGMPEAGGIDPAEFRKELAALRAKGVTSLVLRMNSPGGNVYDGFTMANSLRSAGFKQTTCVVDGECSSIATMIALACDRIEMHATSMMMVHAPRIVMAGTAAQFRTMADDMDKAGEQMASVYLKKSGQTPEVVAKWMSKDTIFSAQEAFDAHLIDAVIEPETRRMAACTTSTDVALARMSMDLFRKTFSSKRPVGQ